MSLSSANPVVPRLMFRTEASPKQQLEGVDMIDLRAETPKFDINNSQSGDRRRESSRNRDSGKKPEPRGRSVQRRDLAVRSGNRETEGRQLSQDKALRPSSSMTQNRLTAMVNPQRMNASLRTMNKSMSAR
jgi:hypothetical protein